VLVNHLLRLKDELQNGSILQKRHLLLLQSNYEGPIRSQHINTFETSTRCLKRKKKEKSLLQII
jgi:hypothetical protein